MAIGRINATLTGVQPGGLAKIVPTSITLGSGSGSVDGNGNITFSSSTSISINGCFSSTYNTYKIILDISSYLAGNPLKMRFRDANGDDTSSNYGSQGPYVSLIATNSAYTANGNTTTSAEIAAESPSDAIWDVFNPFSSTRATHMWGYYQQANTLARTGYLAYVNNKSFTGFTIYANSGTNNITGTIRIYGYN